MKIFNFWGCFFISKTVKLHETNMFKTLWKCSRTQYLDSFVPNILQGRRHAPGPS